MRKNNKNLSPYSPVVVWIPILGLSLFVYHLDNYILLKWFLDACTNLQNPIFAWATHEMEIFSFSNTQWNVFFRFCFVVKNVGRQRDFANFWHFLTWIQFFLKPIELLDLNKVNWVEERLNSCEKMSKICKITLSAFVFTTKQNLGKHSTVL